MKTRMRFLLTLAGAALCALPDLAIAQSGSGNSQGDQEAAIEGAWFLTVSTPQGVQIFTALQSFSAGGVTGTAATLGPTPGWGSWIRVDNKTYFASFYFFVFNSAGVAFEAMRVNNTLTVSDDGNTIKGKATAFTCDLDGHSCVNPMPVNVTGNRVIAQGAS